MGLTLIEGGMRRLRIKLRTSENFISGFADMEWGTVGTLLKKQQPGTSLQVVAMVSGLLSAEECYVALQVLTDKHIICAYAKTRNLETHYIS